MSSSSSYVCDTLPAPRLVHDHPPVAVIPVIDDDPEPKQTTYSFQPPPHRKLCVRHQRMADEGTTLKLQLSLDALPLEEREAVSAVWSNFSSSSHPRRALILQGLLTMCCFSQLSLLTEHLSHLIRIDPFTVLPREVSLKILGYLDATSLCRAAQVTKRWKSLADDNVVWRSICEQHIGQKCHKCGWGLPILEKKRAYRPKSKSPCPSPTPQSMPSLKRSAPDPEFPRLPPVKRQKSEADLSPAEDSPSVDQNSPSSTLLTPDPSYSAPPSITRPWKDVYSERMTIERNWRRNRYSVRTLKGHTDGIMCLQFSESLAHPAFPVLITGSYDRTVRVWNLETEEELQCLKGHSRAVRALQFDEVKLITGSMDCSIKVWDWRRGKCIRTLTGHSEGVVCLNFDDNVLASGSVDSTIKVWNLRTGGAFTLRGHSDWVNSVQLWDSNPGARPSFSDDSIFSVSGSASPTALSNQIDPGKMLFSASDDGTIKLWDLNLRTCVRQFLGHGAQVQTLRLLLSNECDEEVIADEDAIIANESSKEEALDNADIPVPKRTKPILISGSLDNTIKMWDIDSAKPVKTYFGHIEGVWSVASDKMRLVSGSHDRTIKVWSKDKESCTGTLVGHEAAVSCIALGEDKIVSGSDDCTIKVWSFAG